MSKITYLTFTSCSLGNQSIHQWITPDQTHINTHTQHNTNLVDVKDIGRCLHIMTSRDHMKFRRNQGFDLFFIRRHVFMLLIFTTKWTYICITVERVGLEQRPSRSECGGCCGNDRRKKKSRRKVTRHDDVTDSWFDWNPMFSLVWREIVGSCRTTATTTHTTRCEEWSMSHLHSHVYINTGTE